MRITIEPTEDKPFPDLGRQHKRIVIECAGDDHNLYEVIDDLITPALRAWGYQLEGLDTYEKGR